MVLQRVIQLLAACVRRLQVRGAAPSRIRKFALSAVSLPLLLVLLLAVYIYKVLHGPLRIEARARFGARFSCALPSFVQNRIRLFGVWEPDITAFISRRLAAGDTFIDVGANVGYYTLLASQRVGESGRVVAVEVSPSILALLQANLALAGSPPNVRTVHAAAAAAHGTLTVFRAPDWCLNLTSTLPRPGLAPEAQVKAAPLDDLLTPEELATARLVKINVEGTELAVLAGIQRLVAHGRRDLEIVVELTPELWPQGTGRPEEALQPLLDAGLCAYRVDNNYMPWRYLWPEAVRPPRRLRDPIKPVLGGFGCIDLVLSRVDAETL
jgi:FkbM family methyltransferase